MGRARDRRGDLDAARGHARRQHVGHDRLWLDEERRRAANDVRRAVIKSGLGAPLQVTRGQFNEVE